MRINRSTPGRRTSALRLRLASAAGLSLFAFALEQPLAAQTASVTFSEILVNGGAEQGYAGWTYNSSDAPRVYASNPPDSPTKAGDYHFAGGTSAAEEMYQTIDLVSLLQPQGYTANSIANGSATAFMSLWYDSLDGDRARAILQYGTTAANSTGTLHDFGWYGTEGAWVYRSFNAAVPTSARFLRVTDMFQRVAGTNSNGYIDAQSVSLTFTPIAYWVAPSNGYWFEDGRWTAVVPGAKESAYFTQNGTYSVTVGLAASIYDIYHQAGDVSFQISSTMDVENAFHLGNGASAVGRMNVNATMTSTTAIFGENGGTALVTVGSGGYLSNDGSMYLGQSGGTGKLTLQGGTAYVYESTQVLNAASRIDLLSGSLYTKTLDLGNDPSRLNWTSGQLALTGSGLTLGTGGLIGSTLTLTPGKTLSVSNLLEITASGAATLAGGSLFVNRLATSDPSRLTWTSGYLNVGNITVSSAGPLGSTLNVNAGKTLGTGTLKVSAEGQVSLSGGMAYVSTLDLADPTRLSWTSGYLSVQSLNVSQLGSSVTISGGKTLAGRQFLSSGTLAIEGGALLSSNDLSIGTGTAVAIRGTGTRAVTDVITVGNISINGHGLPASTFTVEGGATLTANYLRVSSGSSAVFRGSGTFASVNVVDPMGNYALQPNAPTNPAGTIRIEDNAAVRLGNVYLGYGSSFQRSNLLVDHASLQLTGYLALGYFPGGEANVSISNGGSVTSSTGLQLRIGEYGGKATVAVSGAGSSLSVASSSVTVADYSGFTGTPTTGILSITDGGQATVNTLQIGNGYAQATVAVGGNNARLNAGVLYLGYISQFGPAVPSSMLNIEAGGYVSVDTIALGSSLGRVNLAGGTLSGRNMSLSAPNLNWTGGTLEYRDNVFNGYAGISLSSGKTLRLSDTTFNGTGQGTLTFAGNAQTTIGIGGAGIGQTGKIEVQTFTGRAGLLTIALEHGFTPNRGQTFDLFDWGASSSGTFAGINLPALRRGLTWNTSQLYVTGAISTAVTSNINLTAGGGTGVDRGDVTVTGSNGFYIGSVLNLSGTGFSSGYVDITAGFPSSPPDGEIIVAIDLVNDGSAGSLSVANALDDLAAVAAGRYVVDFDASAGGLLDRLSKGYGVNFDAAIRYSNFTFNGGSPLDFSWDFGSTGITVDQLTVVPEPGSLVWLGAGAGFLRRRRRR